MRPGKLALLGLVALLLGSKVGYADVEQKTYVPDQDTTLSQEQPTNTFGQSPELRLEHAENGDSEEHTLVFLKFDLSEIPTTAKLDSVTLTLTAQQAAVDQSFELQLGKLDQPWQEEDTWEKWGPFDGFVARLAQPRLAVRTIPTDATAGTEIRFNSTVELREVVQEWIETPQRNFGLVVFARDVTNNYRLDFFSREGGQEAEKPSLNIGYQLDDTTPVQIESVQVEDITDRSVKITWKTDRPADSYVDYGTSNNYGTRFGHTTLRTDHTVELQNLAPTTTYHYQVSSTTGSDIVSTSDDSTFQTSTDPPPDDETTEDDSEENEATDTTLPDDPAQLAETGTDEPGTTLEEEQAGQVAGTTNSANTRQDTTNQAQNTNRRRPQGGDLLLSDSDPLETRSTMADQVKDNILSWLPAVGVIGLLILLFRHNIGNYMQGGDSIASRQSGPPKPPRPPTAPPPSYPKQPPQPNSPPPTPRHPPPPPEPPRNEGILDLSQRNRHS